MTRFVIKRTDGKYAQLTDTDVLWHAPDQRRLATHYDTRTEALTDAARLPQHPVVVESVEVKF